MDEFRRARLERLLGEYDRLGIGTQLGYEKLHLYSIITHSTAIEGSTITLVENTLMFDEGLVPKGRQVREQMMNLDLKRAYDFAAEVASSKTPMSASLLKSFSALVMRNTGALYHTTRGTYDESRGEFRLQNVSAGRGGSVYLSWEKVAARTAEFATWLNQCLEKIDDMSAVKVYELSFEAHFRLVTIHPWSDGNGRVARLNMFLIQMEAGVVPSIVRRESRAGYIEALAKSREASTSRPFIDFMTDELIDVLSQEIDEHERSLAADVPWLDEQ